MTPAQRADIEAIINAIGEISKTEALDAIDGVLSSPGAVSSVSGRTLKDYLRHDDGCDKGLCVDCRYTERGGHHSDCPDNCGAKHQFVARECSCGLDALLSVRAERASGQDEQTEDSAGLIHQTIPDVEGTEPRLRQYRCPTCGAEQEAWR